MRAIVDIADPQIKALDDLSKAGRRSRAALIREAIDEYLERRRGSPDGSAFGLWGQDRIDGMTYQEQARGEW